MITVVGLGPSGREDLSVGADEILRSAPTVFVRTIKHPTVDYLASREAKLIGLDYLYESVATFEEVYRRIAEVIVEEATRGADVVYAVPGHPLVGERSVEILVSLARARGLEIRIIGSESFIEPVLEVLGVSVDDGLKIVDALSLDRVQPSTDTDNLIYQVYDRPTASRVKLALMELYPDDFSVTVVSGAGTEEQAVRHVPLHELDRGDFDHLTVVHVSPLAAIEGKVS